MNIINTSTIDNSQKELLEDASFEKLYRHSHLRNNVFCWFPFESNKKVLLINSSSESVHEYLKNNKGLDVSQIVIQNENDGSEGDMTELEFLSDYNENFDYIVLMDTLHVIDNGTSFINKLKSILNPEGYILIAGFNKIGLSLLAGNTDLYSCKQYGSIENNQSAYYTKSGYENLLSACEIENYRFYYPYPDHLFTEEIFTDDYLPKIGQLHNNQRIYGEYRLKMFDETMGFDNAIESNEFSTFSNSFLVVIGNKLNALPKYVKISNQRSEQFQIYTTISNNNVVRKYPFTSKAKQHLEDVHGFLEVLDKEKFKQCNARYCDSEFEDDYLEFEFIHGNSLEKKLKSNKTLTFDDVIACMDLIQNMILCYPQLPFNQTKEFVDVFGEHQELIGKESSLNANVDLILDNIIVNDSYNVIDYEWNFHFAIPNQFILFRTIFHSDCINRLDKSSVMRIYEHYGINSELFDVFFDMEIHFQNYVSQKGMKFEDITDQYTSCIVNQDLFKINEMIKSIRITDDENNIIHQKYFTFSQINDSFNVGTVQGKIRIHLNCGATIVQICEIKIVKKDNQMIEIDHFENNALFQNDNTYFFEDDGYIEIDVDQNDEVGIGLEFYYTNSNESKDVLNLHRSINELLNQHEQLRKQIDILNEQLGATNQKLTEINSNKGVRMLYRMGILKR